MTSSSSSKSLSPYDHPSYSQSSDSLVHALPTRKISSSNFIRMARQASDTAFRSVGLNRKASDHNLREQQSSTISGSNSGGDGGGVVYEQNPRVYLFQQQQQQQQQHQHIKTRRPYCEEAGPEEWAMNNKLLHTESNMSDDGYYDHHNHNHSQHAPLAPIRKPFASKSLRRNISMPDMKNAAAAAAAAGQSSASSCEPHSRATSPQPPSTSQINRSRSRPPVQQHHFITAAMANNDTYNNNNSTREPTTSVIDPTTIDKEAATIASAGDERALAAMQRTPSRPPRNQNHHSDHKLYQQHQSQLEQQRHHEQQRHRLLVTRHQQALPDESLPENGDDVLSMESANANYNTTSSINDSKELPPTPPGPPSSFSLPTRSQRRRVESNNNNETDSSTNMMPAVSDALSRKGSNKGTLPQDVLRSMDPKDVQKAVSSTVIASRVYKVLNPEQLESLKKEQEGLHRFIEAMNVSLHIETRMRDASHSLIRLHETNFNLDAVKGATSQLHATTSKMDQIVQKSQQAMWRLMAIQRLLLQHETAVLNAGLRRLDNENRDLSRSVMNLETAKGQEKEEKLRWKKEHTRLKVQSIMFLPASPTFSDAVMVSKEKSLPPTPNPQMQVVQEQLLGMESYVKELNEEILQKDEKLGEMKNELGAVRGWAEDFEASIIQSAVVHKKDCSTAFTAADPSTVEGEMTLQEKLSRLQSIVEADYKDVQGHADELQVKVDQLTEENLAFATEAADTAAAPCKRCLSNDSTTAVASSSLTEQQQERQARRSWRIRHNSSSSVSSSSSSSSLDLNSVLRESLWELDRQIERDLSSPSSSSASSCRNSSASSAFSMDSISRRSSSRSTASGGRLSRASSSSSGKAVGLREQVLMRDMTSSPEMMVLLSQVIECEDDGEDDCDEQKEDEVVEVVEVVV
ncbi:MAG: Up-regulated during septation-domain-containing protein [Linnemannia gamsii]|nr:MAG: Up-regulated during septation-domain-containing protein [Linnemannia gamsii]